jgi:tRNA/tmRNA/rRNA uracil-C5-methylase (TrmA/RlmC/RlmD family)
MAKGIYAKTEAFLSIVAPGADTEIRLRANLTVGKYAWARMGYQFADAAQHDLVREDFMHLVDKHLAAYPDAVKDRVRKAIALCETPQDFASLTFVDDKGKEILITVPNSGEAKIENTPVGKAFFLDMPSGGWDAVKYPNASAKKDSKKLRR